MRTHARALKGELEGKAAAAIAAQSGIALGLVAGVAVLREGLETALFLISTTTNDGGGSIIVGTLLGLAAATVLGVHRLPGRPQVQHAPVLPDHRRADILFAAGLVSRAILFFQAAGDLGSWNAQRRRRPDPRTRWLTQDTQSGRFLAGIFGCGPAPVDRAGRRLPRLPDPGARTCSSAARARPSRRPAPQPSQPDPVAVGRPPSAESAGQTRRPRARLITRRWTSLVPSPISRILASR